MSYYFFMGGDMLLPVPPDTLSLKISNKNETINLINEGEVNLIKTPGLSEISFNIRLPNRKYPWANYELGFRKADYYLKKLEKLKTEGKPFRFIVSRMAADGLMLHNTNIKVTLEEYSIEESAENGIDIVCPVTLKQYRKFGTKECEVTTNADGTKSLKVKEVREEVDTDTPKAMTIAGELSVLEAAKRISNGSLDWKSVLTANSIDFPGTILEKRTVLSLV